MNWNKFGQYFAFTLILFIATFVCLTAIVGVEYKPSPADCHRIDPCDYLQFQTGENLQ